MPPQSYPQLYRNWKNGKAYLAFMQGLSSEDLSPYVIYFPLYESQSFPLGVPCIRVAQKQGEGFYTPVNDERTQHQDVARFTPINRADLNADEGVHLAKLRELLLDILKGYAFFSAPTPDEV